MKKIRTYTVVLLYPNVGYDPLETYTETVKAAGSRDAINKVQRMAMEANEGMDMKDFEPVSVFSGKPIAWKNE